MLRSGVLMNVLQNAHMRLGVEGFSFSKNEVVWSQGFFFIDSRGRIFGFTKTLLRVDNASDSISKLRAINPR